MNALQDYRARLGPGGKRAVRLTEEESTYRAVRRETSVTASHDNAVLFALCAAVMSQAALDQPSR